MPLFTGAFSTCLLAASLCAATRHPVLRMTATAFSNDSKPTSAGTQAHDGIVAADPAVLPLGSRIRITGAGAFSGVYTVTDTGSKIAGRHLDIFIPSRLQAERFGKRIVRVQVLDRGEGKQDARDKEAASRLSTAH